MIELIVLFLLTGKITCDIDENTEGQVQITNPPPTVIISINKRF